MLRLSREDSVLLLTSRAFLSKETEKRLQILARGEVNWAYVAWRAENNRTIPLLEYHLRRLDSLGCLPENVRVYIQRWSVMSRLRSVLQFRDLANILDALEQAGIPNFLVKGPDLALLHYPEPFLRPMTDLDIMIRPADILRVQQLMLELGYSHGLFNPANGGWTPECKPLNSETLRDTYALPVFVRIERAESPFAASEIPAKLRQRHVKSFIDDRRIMHMPIFIDIHFNLSVGLHEQDIWSGVRLANVLDRTVRVQSSTAAVWFLAARLYHEAFLYNSLRLLMLSDLHAVLHGKIDDVDWAEVAAIAYRYEMRPALYYVLAQVRSLFEVDIPEPFLDLIRPAQTEIPLQHDWGDIVPKLFSIPHLNEISLPD